MTATFSDPAAHAAVVSASDTADLPMAANSLFLIGVGANATMTLTTVSGEKIALSFGTSAYTVPIHLPIQTKRVWNTGLSGIATTIALWQ
jgi:hypothetical protein